jgi:phospholipase/carboxylesterase
MAERLPCVVVETGDEPTSCVVWLHGLGADGHDFEPLVPYLGLPDDLPTRFVFPHAPIRPVTINGGMEMRAWYDILDLSIDRDLDEEGILDSAARVRELLAAERERGIPSERTVLAGFSQGGAIAAFVGLRHDEPLAGVLVLSAYLPLEDRLSAEASIENRATPILICHGEWDPVVPIALGGRTARLLSERGYGVEWRTYPVPHSVHPEEVAHIGKWLVRVLRGAEP